MSQLKYKVSSLYLFFINEQSSALKTIFFRQNALLAKQATLITQAQCTFLTTNQSSTANKILKMKSEQAHHIFRHQMPIRQLNNLRQFSSSQKKEDSAQSEYEKSFADLLGKGDANKKDTVKDQAINEEQKRLRQQKEAEEDADYARRKEELERQKQQDFEDMLSGKQKKKKDDMNLQELFKDYYSKVKTADPKEYVNSAKSSLNSFSSLLEKRRQKAAESKQTKQEEGAAKTKAGDKQQQQQEGEPVQNMEETKQGPEVNEQTQKAGEEQKTEQTQE